jgi:hypothetical protein
VQSGKVCYAQDTGSANFYSVSLTPIPAAIPVGMVIRVLIANSNTGASTLTVNGFSAGIWFGGAPLPSGVMKAGTCVEFIYDGTHWELIAGFYQVGDRPVIKVNTTFYVNGGTGSDTLYDGTTATISGSSGPFATIQHAVDVLASYEFNGHSVTIQVADWIGYYDGFGISYRVNGYYAIRGNETTPGNCKIRPKPYPPGPMFGFTPPGVTLYGTGVYVQVTGFQISATPGNNCYSLISQAGAFLVFGCMEFGDAGPGGIHQYCDAGLMGTLNNPLGDYKITGGGFAHILAFGSYGYCVITPSSPNLVTIVGTPTFTYYALCHSLGMIRASGGTNGTTYAGNIVGQKYYIYGNAVIDVQGAGANFLPGTIAGTTATGGLYLP